MEEEKIDELMKRFDLSSCEGKRDCHIELDKLYKEDLIAFIIMKQPREK